MFNAIVQLGKSTFGSIATGIMDGVASYFSSKAAQAQAKSKARVASANASILRSQKVTQDIANRQALDALAQQRNAVTAAYRDQQGANIAGAGAANVDISSGSAAQILEGNAQRYSQDMARSRYAEALQMWQGESALSMLEAQAKGYEISSSAQRSIANIIDPLGTAIGVGALSQQKAFFGTGGGESLFSFLSNNVFNTSGTSGSASLSGSQRVASNYGSSPRMTDSQWDSLFKSYGL